VTAQIPAAVEFRQVLAIALLVAVCFIVGLIVRTGPGLRAKECLRAVGAGKASGYTFLRGLAGRLTGRSEEHTLQPALVEIEETLVPALIVEKLDDGSYTVLVPSAPDANGWQYRHLAARPGPSRGYSAHQGTRRILEMGTGAGEFVRAMKSRSDSPTDWARP
jgi:hypothetical protein